MDLRFAIDQADVANQRDQFNLLLDWDIAICLFRGIEPAELSTLQCTDSRKISRSQLSSLSKLGETGKDFVSFSEYESVSRFSIGSLVNAQLARAEPIQWRRDNECIFIIMTIIPPRFLERG
jgi:hypothetical protein